MFKDKLRIKGTQIISVRDKYGKIKPLWNENELGKILRKKGLNIRIPLLTGMWQDKLVVENTITYAGYAGMASRLNGADAEAAFTYLAVGTGDTAAATSDTTLDAEITDSGLERAAATCTREDTDQTDDTAQLSKTWTASGTKTIVECGAFNAASDGTLLGRQVFSPVGVVSGDTFGVIYKFQILV